MRKKKRKGFKRIVDNKMRSWGDTDLEKKVIRINKKKSKNVPFKKSLPKGYPEVLDTIVHEEMHAKYPKMKEMDVRKKTRRMIEKMTKKQKSKYYSRFT